MLIYRGKKPFSGNGKNPHFGERIPGVQNVDNVDNLLAKQFFPHFYNISGAHSYQQVTAGTIL